MICDGIQESRFADQQIIKTRLLKQLDDRAKRYFMVQRLGRGKSPPADIRTMQKQVSPLDGRVKFREEQPETDRYFVALNTELI